MGTLIFIFGMLVGIGICVIVAGIKSNKGEWRTIWFGEGVVDKFVFETKVGESKAYARIQYNDVTKKAKATKIVNGVEHDADLWEFCRNSKEVQNVCEEFMIKW